MSGHLVLDAGSLAVARKSDFHWLDLTIAFVFHNNELLRSLGNPYPIGDDLPRHYARLPLAAAQPLASMRPKFDV